MNVSREASVLAQGEVHGLLCDVVIISQRYSILLSNNASI